MLIIIRRFLDRNNILALSGEEYKKYSGLGINKKTVDAVEEIKTALVNEIKQCLYLKA